MTPSTKKDRNSVRDSIPRNQTKPPDTGYAQSATALSGDSATLENRPSQTDLAAQAEFMDDIRVSLQEMKEGKVLPAEKALEIIELGLDDDELEGLLSQEIHDSGQ